MPLSVVERAGAVTIAFEVLSIGKYVLKQLGLCLVYQKQKLFKLLSCCADGVTRNE